MSRFLIGIVGYGKNPHAPCFLDYARAIASALRALGHEAEYATEEARRQRPGRLILFGANNLRDGDGEGAIPEDAIIFNSEQLAAVADPKFFLQNYLQYRNMVVWDYSEANIAELKKLGIERAVHCPVGYVPSMETIAPTAEEDIDVLFYGSVAGPRREILDALDAAKLNVVRLFGVYDKARDEYIARSKVVLNLHYYPHGIFEIFRVSHLLANKKCVVTEAGGRDQALESFASRACFYVPREEIVAGCCALVDDARVRSEIAERGYQEFKKLDLVGYVRRALEVSS